jgi:hypothetical protein
MHREHGALPGLALAAAAVRFHEPFHDGQAHAELALAYESGKFGLAEVLLITRSALDARRGEVEAVSTLA